MDKKNKTEKSNSRGKSKPKEIRRQEKTRERKRKSPEQEIKSFEEHLQQKTHHFTALFTAGMIAIISFCIGAAAGNFMPDYTDVIYFAAVANGTIANPTVALLVYYVYPGAFWAGIAILLMIGFYFHWWGIRFAIWFISAIIISSTIILIFIINPLFYSITDIIIDIILCIACVVSIVWVELEYGKYQDGKKGKK
jgi:hypothetical protein